MFKDEINTRLGWLLASLAMLFAGCEPNAIEPLPSPGNPDSPITTSIVLSSLTVDEDSPDEGLVVVIGLDGAVAGVGQIRITNPRKIGSFLYPTRENGAFVASVEALPGDVIAVSFIDSELRESLPIDLEVQAYVAPQHSEIIGGKGPPADGGDGSDGGDGGDGSDGDDDGSGNTGKAADVPKEPDFMAANEGGEASVKLVLNYANGQAHFIGGENFIGANDILVIANESDGNAYYTTADDNGAVDFSFPAQPGDTVVMFSQNPLNPALTSPAHKFVIPEGNNE
jgi:signal peptidase I